MSRMIDWFVKQWQRVNLTYTFIRVPIDIMKLLIWFLMFVAISDVIPLTLTNVLVIGMIAGVVLLVLGYVFDRTGVFYKYQGQVDKIMTAERDVHRWRISGAYVARAILIGMGENTDRIDALIEKEKKWFFPMTQTDEVKEEFHGPK